MDTLTNLLTQVQNMRKAQQLYHQLEARAIEQQDKALKDTANELIPTLMKLERMVDDTVNKITNREA